MIGYWPFGTRESGAECGAVQGSWVFAPFGYESFAKNRAELRRRRGAGAGSGLLRFWPSRYVQTKCLKNEHMVRTVWGNSVTGQGPTGTKTKP